MSTRPLQILQRFPAHLEPARPDKLLWAVVEALAADLDVLAADLAGVRRAHRLKDADTLRDLLLLASLHGLDRGLVEILFVRAARVRALAKQLEEAAAAHDSATRNARAESLFALWGTPAPATRLPLYAPPPPQGQLPDLDAAAHALSAAASDSVSSRRLLEGARTRLTRVCELHSHGNGTLRAVLMAAANALDMDIDGEKNAEVMDVLRGSPNDQVDLSRTDGYFHSRSRYLHLTYVRDRLQPASPPALPYALELLGIEENPVDPLVATGEGGPGDIGPVTNKELFPVMRRGFANERLHIEIKGMNGRTRNLQFVHRDEGRGLCFAGIVPDGSTLTINEEGKFSLGGVDVGDKAFTWEGGCFGDSANPSNRDWCFGGPRLPAGSHPASFAKTTPPGCLDAGAVFPHPRVPLAGAGISIGLNRFAFFVAPVANEDPAQEVADITLSWIERQPYVLKVWIPARFQALDSPQEETVLQKLQRALERFRPMGVETQPAYSNAEWGQVITAMLTPAP
jgi:hypothetical protein